MTYKNNIYIYIHTHICAIEQTCTRKAGVVRLCVNLLHHKNTIKITKNTIKIKKNTIKITKNTD